MYRMVKMGNRWLGVELKNRLDEDEMENIQSFLDNDEPVLIVNNLEGVESILEDEEWEILEGEQDEYK
jgi:hypothetical protein